MVPFFAIVFSAPDLIDHFKKPEKKPAHEEQAFKFNKVQKPSGYSTSTAFRSAKAFSKRLTIDSCPLRNQTRGS